MPKTEFLPGKGGRQPGGRLSLLTQLARLTGLALVLSLTACATTDINAKLDLDNNDPGEIKRLFAPEREHLNGKKPRIGLALAGGGTRAGLFAHGVLAGLSESKVLPHVDVISSVSGGGYAAMWYFTKLLENRDRPGFTPDMLFADCWAYWRRDLESTTNPQKATPSDQHTVAAFKHAYTQGKATEKDSCDTDNKTHFRENDPYRWQAHLLRWPDVFGTTYTPMTSETERAPYFDAAGLGLNVAVELLFGWTGVIDSGVPDAYQAGIERTWGLNPAPRSPSASDKPPLDNLAAWSYTNQDTSSVPHFGPRMKPDSATFTTLRTLYRGANPPPVWVLQTTMADKGDLPNLNNLYEISPFLHGTPNKDFGGYRAGDLPKLLNNIPTAVRASAAFADEQGIPPGAAHTFVDTIARLIPAARWGVRTELETGDRVRLSDGGGVDNLGLMSLVRRRLDHIIVVDSAQDFLGRIEDICWAKKALEFEKHSLTFDALDNLDQVCSSHFTKTPKNEQLGYNVSMWFNPVVEGKIISEATGKVTHVWLIKPAWNQQAVRKAFNQTSGASCGRPPALIPCGLVVHYGKNTKDHDNQGYLTFPETGTVANTYDSSSYRTLAFRELGRMYASFLVYSESNEGGELSINPLHKSMHQPTYIAEPGAKRSGKPICDANDDVFCGQGKSLN